MRMTCIPRKVSSGLRPRITCGFRTAGRSLFFARAKKRDEKNARPDGATAPRLSPRARSVARQDIPVLAGDARASCPRLFVLPALGCEARRAIRDGSKTLPRFGFPVPVAAAEHRSPPRGIREPFDRARGAYFAPGELGERRGGREAQEAVGGAGVSFLLVTFLWTSKEKSPAVGQPPTSMRGRRPLDCCARH